MITWSLSSEVLEWVSECSYLIISSQPNRFLAAMLLRRGFPPNSRAGDFCVLHLTGANNRQVFWKGEGKLADRCKVTCRRTRGGPRGTAGLLPSLLLTERCPKGSPGGCRPSPGTLELPEAWGFRAGLSRLWASEQSGELGSPRRGPPRPEHSRGSFACGGEAFGFGGAQSRAGRRPGSRCDAREGRVIRFQQGVP